mmetsp:Transcript_12047/g.31513  ORF Transcript_12047/g.31513 Transcript_12047/m.31513 type:complete len:211 (+) Transcript_12047:192-824(+)
MSTANGERAAACAAHARSSERCASALVSSNQHTSLMVVAGAAGAPPAGSAMHASASSTHERASPRKSAETSGSAVTPSTPRSRVAAARSARPISLGSGVGVRSRAVMSAAHTHAVGTRNAELDSRPLSLGTACSTVCAAVLGAGMMFWRAPRPTRQVSPGGTGPSTAFCATLFEQTIESDAASTPGPSSSSCSSGAQQPPAAHPAASTGV